MARIVKWLLLCGILAQGFLTCLSSTEGPAVRMREHRTYLFFSHGSSWNRNRRSCQNISGDLVSMETEDEWQFVTNEIQNLSNRFSNEWHIGLKRHKSSKAWLWLTGVSLEYDHWQPFQPSGDGKCANIAKEELQSLGGLNDLPCHGWYSPKGYICEIDTHKGRSETGAVFTEKWNNNAGLHVSNLTSSPNYPSNPTSTFHQDSFHIVRTHEYNYGNRMRSYFLAPLTGNFTFYPICDDSCEIFLSRGINPENKRLISYHRANRNRRAEAQFLVEGKLYYMEVLFKQGGGTAELIIYLILPGDVFGKTMSARHLRRDVREIDRPGKDCVEKGDPLYPDYKNCVEFTQLDKLNGVKTALQELQSNIADNTKPSTVVLEYSMKAAARKITFLLDETDSPSEDKESDDNVGFEVAKEVEQLGEMVAKKLSNQEQPITMEYPNIMLQIKKLGDNFIFPDKNRNDSSFTTNDEISIKKSVSDTGNYLVFSSLYKNLGDILRGNISMVNGNSEGKFFLNSRIITSSLVPSPKLEKDSVRLRLQHKRFKSIKGQTMVCAFWKYNSSTENSTGSWSSDGCRLNEHASNENFSVCHCDHLTHFAVLMKVTDDVKPLSQSHLTALEAITYVGCSMSLIGEALTIITLTCLRLTRAETNMIHLNLVVALGLAQLFFLSGINATANKGLCIFVAIALHFFNLVAFCWMLVEGLWLYVMVVRVFDTGYNRIRRYVIAAWSIPAVIVIVTLVSSFDGYGTKNSCWLSVSKGTIWSFVVPVLVIVLVNATILGLVVREILRLHNPTPADDTRLKTVRSGVKSAIVLLPILGIAWVFGILAVNSDTIVFQYLFAIFNSLQGFLIFIFHCVLNSEVRKAFRRKKQIWSDSHLFQCHSVSPPPKYDSEMSTKETKSTSNGVERRPPSSTSTSRIFLK